MVQELRGRARKQTWPQLTRGGWRCNARLHQKLSPVGSCKACLFVSSRALCPRAQQQTQHASASLCNDTHVRATLHTCVATFSSNSLCAAGHRATTHASRAYICSFFFKICEA